MNETEFINHAHVKVHVLRELGQNPTKTEFDFNKLVAEYFKDTCVDCKEAHERLKYQKFEPKKGMLSFLGGK